jgi:hypothetical protein
MKKLMKITLDSYTFVEHKGEELWYVKIKEGDYKDVIYKYGRIEVLEVGDHAKLKFEFKVEKWPDELDMTEEDFNEDATFMNILGDILIHILEDAMETGKYKLGNDDKPTDSESTVHE